MENKKIGNLLITISIIVGIVFLIFGISAKIVAGKSILLTIQTILGLLIFLGIAALGANIQKKKEKIYTDIPQIEIMKFEKELPELEETSEPIKEVKTTEKKTTTSETKNLNNDEKRVIRFLKKAEENELMQSELIKKMKITKVKMTRILKKLEDKDLILKKRIGMNNIVILQ